MRLRPDIVVRVLVLLALFVRVLPVPAMAMLDPIPGGIPICHSDGGEAPSTPDEHRNAAHDCVLCPVCLTAAPLAFLHHAAVAIPSPSAVLASTMVLPPATGPPGGAAIVVRSRGPPV